MDPNVRKSSARPIHRVPVRNFHLFFPIYFDTKTHSTAVFIFFFPIVPSPPKIDGQWSSFGPWQECSAKCGGGIQVRRRRCDTPPPRNGGAPCSGCNLEYRPCNSQSCPEVRRPTNWTPWMKHVNSSTMNGFYEERHRFSCHAPIAEARMIRFGQMKSERRFCYYDGRGCAGACEYLFNGFSTSIEK